MTRLTRVTEQLIRPLVPEALPASPSPSPVTLPALPARIFPSAPTGPSESLLWMAFPARCGRVTAQHLLRALNWFPEQRLDIQSHQAMVIVTPSEDGRHQVGSRGELPLPASARQMCRIEPGEPVLLAAFTTHGLLVVHPISTVTRLLTELHDQLAGADNDR